MASTSSADVDKLLVPGMMSMNVADAREKLTSLCNEMQESEQLTRRIDDRLRFLHDHPEAAAALKIPAQYADALGGTVTFAKKYSSKSLLERIAASRRILLDARAIHTKIDVLFIELGLKSEPEMAAWETHWDDDVAAQAERFLANLSGSVSTNDCEEAVTELRYELEQKRDENTAEHLAVIERALALPGLPAVPDLPDNYIPRDDVDIRGESFGDGFIGELYKATWGASKKQVTVKQFFLDSNTVQTDFLKQAATLSRLHHPNVLEFHGGCHVGKPVFTVIEFAGHGNFAMYFKEPARQCKLWHLVREAAEGLAYLHEQGVVHGDVRCNNVLVGSDGKAKLSDASYSNIRRMSIGKSLKGTANSIRWTAPECLLEQGRAAEPSVASDIYSFGMTIIEAKTGAHPWPSKTDDQVIDHFADFADRDTDSDATVLERPQEHFTEAEWAIVEALCAFAAADRLPLAKAIEMIGSLPSVCASCDERASASIDSSAAQSKFCGECGCGFVARVAASP